MGKVLRIALSVFAVLVLAAIMLVLRTMIAAGVFTEVKPAFAGTCKTLTGIVGAEDIAIDAKDRLVFLSATDRRAPPNHPSRQDGLYTMALDHPEAGFMRLSGTPPAFHPHGIGLYRAPDGSLTLMAVNHPKPGRSAILIFEVAVAGGAAKLTEVGSVEGDLLVSVNDVAPVGKNRFYATNDHGSRTPLGMQLENYLMLPRGNVVYFDGAVLHVAADGLAFANGVALSKDMAHVYVAETTARTLHAYARDAFSGALKEEKTLAIPSDLDNIDVDANGALWVGGHPKMFALIAYAGDASKPSPSQIFKVETAGGIPQTARAVYTDMGGQIGASSVGAVADGHLFIGSIFDPKILDCVLR